VKRRRATTLSDLAKLAGVSITTASRALNDSPSVNEQTKRRIWALAREREYPFRRYMPAGPTTAAATVAIVIPPPQGRDRSLFDPFVMELIAGVGEAARARGCDFLVSHAAPTDFASLAALMATNRANGAVFLGQSSLHAAFNRLAEHETRFVVWGAQVPGQLYCSVGSDNPAGGRLATTHLVRVGRRRIGFLGATEAPEALQRYHGYLDGLAANGLAADPQLVFPSQFELEAAEAATDALLGRRKPLDAIVAASDVIALGAIRALTRAGLRVPEDVAVVGYDDIQFARLSRPELTTVRQDTRLAGRLLVAKLLESDSTGALRSERVATELVVRKSCGAGC
jgi:DNA-binding LacI/PurR family transcriptional regulator